ncbi:hypothetical protein COU60_00645 [Candidatus Pacearchaeota archaeon CG10_big_fil_rev_8_21_14_0_10_34_76]|nr:MAG: hypothetical protein COU60_00645 [Candidatus Pacearchaeota archaeon CG10_big_fil_rev_8_21_14_0_10_34_76]
MAKKFIRRDSHRFSKLGRGRKKLQKWRGAKGRDNKIREKRFSYPSAPSVGYKNSRAQKGKIKNLIPIVVRNLKDLQNANKENIIIIGKVGAKKRIDIMKKTNEMKLEIVNVRKEKKE